jgi:ribosomal protein S18 acetylase RimI-like enzyme
MADSRAAQNRDGFSSYALLLEKSCTPEAAAARGPSSSAASTASTALPGTPSAGSATSSDDSVHPVPTKDNVQFLRNVSVHGPHQDERIADLLRQTRNLSEIVFDEDCLLDVTKKSGWKLSLLATADFSVLCGFIVAKVVNGALSIAKLAVPSEFRGLGLGKLIMDEMVKSCKKQGDVYEICLSSLSTAVTFYQRLGFKAHKGLKIKTDKDVVEGQVYMEKKLRPRQRRK